MEINLTHKSKSTTDLALNLKNAIEYFDGKVFKKPIKVTIVKNKFYAKRPALCFASKRKIFKILGLTDEYFIFQNSEQLCTLMEREYAVVSSAIHEVRHRVQHYHNDHIIRLDFVRQSKYFPKGMIDFLYKNIYPRHAGDKKLFEREFDSSLMETLFASLYKNRKMTLDLVVELLMSNESNVEKILSRLD